MVEVENYLLVRQTHFEQENLIIICFQIYHVKGLYLIRIQNILPGGALHYIISLTPKHGIQYQIGKKLKTILFMKISKLILSILITFYNLIGIGV